MAYVGYKESRWVGCECRACVLMGVALLFIIIALHWEATTPSPITSSLCWIFTPFFLLLCFLLAAVRLRQLYSIFLQHTQRALATSHASSTSPEVIQVIPKVSLFDQKVHIKAQGLPSQAKVTLHLATQQEWRRKPVEFMSCSHYVTSNHGDLDLNRDASVGGTYTGIQVL